MQNEMKRLPAIERNINEINEKDIRVRLTGKVIDSGEDFIVIDDGTGKIKVSLSDNPFSKEVDQKPADTLSVLGRVIPLEKGYEINGEAFQDMSKLDLSLRKRVVSCLKQH